MADRICKGSKDANAGAQVYLASSAAAASVSAPVTPIKLSATSGSCCDTHRRRNAFQPPGQALSGRIEDFVTHLRPQPQGQRQQQQQEEEEKKEPSRKRRRAAHASSETPALLPASSGVSSVTNVEARSVDVQHARDLSPEDFASRYMLPNLPIIIQGATEGWAANRKWVAPDGRIDVEALIRELGSCLGWATDVKRLRESTGRPPRQSMSVAEFFAWWRQHRGRKLSSAAPGWVFSAENGADEKACCGPDDCSDGLLYFSLELSKCDRDHKAFETPPHFRDDWLGTYSRLPEVLPFIERFARHEHRRLERRAALEPQESAGSETLEPDPMYSQEEQPSEMASRDYCFVFLGPKGTWTRFHIDVMESFSWSTNVVGFKRWLLLPPCHKHLLYDSTGRHMAPDLSPEVLADTAQFPHLADAAARAIEVIQGPGDTIFVPSGWAHMVENLDDSLSVNHNWINGYNIGWVWDYLQRQSSVAEAVVHAEDAPQNSCTKCSPEELEERVQRKLKESAGLDFNDMEAFLAAIYKQQGEQSAEC